MLDILQIPKGLTCVIGGGGKTALLYVLGKHLSTHGRVILCATAKMYAPAGVPLLVSPTEEALAHAMRAHTLIAVGDPAPDQKLTLSKTPLSMLLAYGDYVIAEADGSHGRPLKAHAAYEPVLPPDTARTILVLGVDGVGMRISEAAHRPELYAALISKTLEQHVAPEDVADVVNAERYGDMALINKVESAAQFIVARAIAARLNIPAAIGSIKEERICLP